LLFVPFVPCPLFLADYEIVSCDVFFVKNNLADFNASTTPFSYPILACEVQWRLVLIVEFSDICNQYQVVPDLLGYYSFWIIDVESLPTKVCIDQHQLVQGCVTVLAVNVNIDSNVKH